MFKDIRQINVEEEKMTLNLLKRLQKSDSVSASNHLIKQWKNDKQSTKLEETLDDAKAYYQNL